MTRKERAQAEELRQKRFRDRIVEVVAPKITPYSCLVCGASKWLVSNIVEVRDYVPGLSGKYGQSITPLVLATCTACGHVGGIFNAVILGLVDQTTGQFVEEKRKETP